jgi:hypothetical protein
MFTCACTAEIDQLFERFKPACRKSTLRVASKKMQMRMSARTRNDVIKVDGSDASSEDEAEEPDEIADR